MLGLNFLEEDMGRRKKGDDISGWLIIDKPRDMGSTEVVNLTRRLFNARKNGHTGTLDPFATGVLPIAFGEATKVIPFVTDGPKEYEFVIQWGQATSTGDTEGEIIGKTEKIPSRDEILRVIPDFLGSIKQVPPAYSAIKIDGRRAYDLVRQGETVDIPERIVEIYYLELLEELTGNQARFKVGCSKGTYVRTLGQDLALALGSLGYLRELRRTKCGNFTLEDTILLENLKNIVHIEDLRKVLLPVITSLRDIAELAVTEADAAKLRQGQAISPRAYQDQNLNEGVAFATCNGELTAILRIEEKRISPERVFNFNNGAE